MECAGQVEIDDYCRKVLEKHWPDVKRIGDIREVKGDEFGAVDVICGGFPCQPHSLAGKRRGAKDDRNLWPEYRRLVEAIRPSWVVGENVPGLAYTMLDEIVSDLEDLHYKVATLDIPAIAFDAPHIRRRLFIMAYADKQGLEGRDGRIGKECSVEQFAWAGGSHLAHADTERRDGRAGEFRAGWRREFENGSRWQPEPGVGRVANGIPRRMDRLRALGNAVVPQVAEWLGRRIMEATL
jgi:DNA (cytosine-5)-methyltransferase 1